MRPLFAQSLLFVIPAKAGLRRQDAGANIRAANGPKGTRQESRVIQLLALACSQKQSLHSPCGRAGYFLALPQKVTKKV